MADTLESLGAVPVEDQEPITLEQLGAVPVEPNMAPAKKALIDNYNSKQPENAEVEKSQTGETKTAKSFMEVLEAGWDLSVSGLALQKKLPDVQLAPDASRMEKFAANVAQVAGDVPAMLAGGMATSEFGPAGAMAGSFALPAALRKVLMDNYAKGDLVDFNDFFHRASGAYWEAMKGGIVGALTGIAGKAVSPFVQTASPLVRAAAIGATEVATMTTAGAAVEGHVPSLDDFLNASLLIGAAHGIKGGLGLVTEQVSPKLMKTYAETGVKPEEVMEMSQKDPLVRQDLVSSNKEVPDVIADAAKKANLAPEQISSEFSRGAGEKSLKEEVSSPDLTDAEKTVLSKIGKDKDLTKKWSSALEGKIADMELFDDLRPVKDLDAVKDPNAKAIDSAEEALRRSRRWRTFLNYAITENTIDYNGNDVGPGLDKFMPPAKEIPNLNAYLLAKRTESLAARGVKTIVDPEAAKEVVKNSSYAEPGKKFSQWHDDMFRLYGESGRFTPEETEAILKNNPDYASLSKVITEENEGKSSKLGFEKRIESAKPDAELVRNPLMSGLKNAGEIFKFVEENRAKRILLDQARATPDGPVKEITAEEYDKKDSIKLWENGEQKYLKFQDATVARAMQELHDSPVIQNIYGKIAYDTAKTVAKIKRGGIVLTPMFQFMNFFKDQWTAVVQSKENVNIVNGFKESFQAMHDILSESPEYKEFLKSGASASFFDGQKDFVDKYIADLELDKKTSFFKAAKNVVTKPLEYAEWIGTVGEQSTRLAEFKRVKNASIQRGFTPEEARMEGGRAANEVTVDFNKRGRSQALQLYEGLVPFMRAQKIGARTAIGNLKRPEVWQRSAQYVVAAGVATWIYNYNDKRIENLPDYVRNQYWSFGVDDWQKVTDPKEIAGLPEYKVRQAANGEYEVNKGFIASVKKPQEFGIFSSFMENMLDAVFKGKPKAFQGFATNVGAALAPNYMPAILAPVIEQNFNRNLFTDTPLVPDHMEELAPRDRYFAYTSETAKQLSKLINFSNIVSEANTPSPIILENWVRQLGGSTGMFALKIIDKALVAKGIAPPNALPSDTLADNPYVGALIRRDPSIKAQPIQDVYNEFKQYDVIKNSYNAAIKLGEKGQQRAAELEKIMTPEWNDTYQRLSLARAALITNAKRVRGIMLDPDMNKDEKRQLIDASYYEMIEAARYGTNREVTPLH